MVERIIKKIIQRLTGEFPLGEESDYSLWEGERWFEILGGGINTTDYNWPPDKIRKKELGQAGIGFVPESMLDSGCIEIAAKSPEEAMRKLRKFKGVMEGVFGLKINLDEISIRKCRAQTGRFEPFLIGPWAEKGH